MVACHTHHAKSEICCDEQAPTDGECVEGEVFLEEKHDHFLELFVIVSENGRVVCSDWSLFDPF